ncbi:MAG: RecQ family ATP-dependent DNA helicase [Gemmatimonadaceae bacterium]|nr:RecQ family ATP-dependent DNA helicase [Chitinophagaceae bacterium]
MPSLSTDIHSILKNYWGYSNFRPLQEKIIRSILDGKDTLALMPTGGGKSLCYQVPAMAMDGLCLVVSPLIALMKDQVSNLKSRGITAFAIHTGMKRYEVINTLKTASDSNCKFLYVSPERLETKLFLEYLPGLNVSLLAVDEAHCISQWGYDFRPPYLRIAALREELRGIPVLALTASATPDVQEDICKRLSFSRHEIFKASFARPNLSYSIFEPDSKIVRLIEILGNVKGTAIVYCMSRRKTTEIANQLLSYGISADYYHAGLTGEERSKKQEAWIKNDIRVIVCTNAFGMGIDKPDVRLVVHMDLPDCLENYYQEAGRGGRDEKKSYAVLLYRKDEIDSLRDSVADRFPDLTTIRNIYQGLANYFQLETGKGEGQFFEFEITDFAKRFQIPAGIVMNVLRVLGQEGFLSFNEQVFLPAKAMFICNKETLYQFENDNEALEPLITLMLRTYEGVFDIPVNIFENQLAGWLGKTPEAIKTDLTTLDRYQIISYEPQKDKPQIYYLQSRMRTENVNIDAKAYEEKKQRFIKRLEAFAAFIINKTDCRSQQIAIYFGDGTVQPCGVCDNCLAKKKTPPLNETEFSSIKETVMRLIKTDKLTPAALVAKLVYIDKEKLMQVLTLLQAEKTIVLNGSGKLE